MFGVIVCPHCTLVQGADLSMARITCPRCGGKIDVKRAKVYFSTDSAKDLAEAVRQVGQRLVYDIEMPSQPSPLPQANEPGPFCASDEQSLRDAVLDMPVGKEGFGPGDLATKLRISDPRKLDELIARMLECGIIYELSPGRYRPA